MTLVMEGLAGIKDRKYPGQRILDRMVKYGFSMLKSYRRDQSELRRMYMTSSVAQQYSLRVWKAHGSLLKEIADRQKVNNL